MVGSPASALTLYFYARWAQYMLSVFELQPNLSSSSIVCNSLHHVFLHSSHSHARSIKTRGPQFTLRVSSIICICLLGVMCGVTGRMKGFAGQISVVLFYAFREIYVSLISTQQWAFIASLLDSSTSSYMVKFSGIVSISSAFAGCTIELLVSMWGLKGLTF